MDSKKMTITVSSELTLWEAVIIIDICKNAALNRFGEIIDCKPDPDLKNTHLYLENIIRDELIRKGFTIS